MRDGTGWGGRSEINHSGYSRASSETCIGDLLCSVCGTAPGSLIQCCQKLVEPGRTGVRSGVSVLSSELSAKPFQNVPVKPGSFIGTPATADRSSNSKPSQRTLILALCWHLRHGKLPSPPEPERRANSVAL